MARDVWTSRDLPVLDAAVEITDQTAFAFPTASEIAQRTGLELDAVLAGLRALEQAGLIAVTFTMGGGAQSHIDAISGQARQMVGAWPTEEAFADRIIATAEAMLESDLSDAERTKWQAILDGVMSAGRDVLVQMAAMVMTGRLPH